MPPFGWKKRQQPSVRAIRLQNGGEVTLTCSCGALGLTAEEREFVRRVADLADALERRRSPTTHQRWDTNPPDASLKDILVWRRPRRAWRPARWNTFHQEWRYRERGERVDTAGPAIYWIVAPPDPEPPMPGLPEDE